MQREVFTSQVLKIGMIFLAASEIKGYSLVSKRDLERPSEPARHKDDPLESSSFTPFTILFLNYCNYIFFFFFNFAQRMYLLKY